MEKHISLKLLCLILIYQTPVVSCTGYMRAAQKMQNKPSSTHETKEVLQGHFASISVLLRNTSLKTVDDQYAFCNGIDIREITIYEIQELFRQKKLTSVQLTHCYLQRIYKMNHILRAVIQVNPDAIAQAYFADKQRSLGYKSYHGPMLGIPILLKDNIAILDKTETTAGSFALLGIHPNADADVVRLLRKAGAVFIGKSNLSEFANFRGTNIPNGWSGRGGQTLNPYNFKEDPLGSSSGSAAGVAANLATLGVGTETDGSLMAPSSVQGLCTIKATLGLISTHGVIPISHNQDNVGPMARTVTDMVILFDALTFDGVKRKWACRGSYLNCLSQSEPYKRFRVGIPRTPFWDTNIVNSTYLEFELPQLFQIAEKLKESPQFVVVDPVEGTPGIYDSLSYLKELIILLHDCKHDINEYLKRNVLSPYATPLYKDDTLPLKRIATLADIIQYNIDHPSPEGYNQDLLVMAEATDGLRNATYVEAKESTREAARKYLESLLLNYKLDGILISTEPRLGTDLERFQFSPLVAYSIAAMSGFPAVNIPGGIGLNGVPFGLTLIGRPYSEGKLFQMAYAIEQMTHKRVPPQFLVS